ncbi:AraC-type DNA-binding protein [Tenacibaculum sp. MAR_2009_124]|nr:AraC-type DNA-binding protein [Tenacibaculum sp. MAR_2009_124]
MNLTFLEIFVLISIIHCFLLGVVILTSKLLRGQANFYLGISLVILAIVGVNNWFWDIGNNPYIIRFFDLFLWQFLYPTTLFIYFLLVTKNGHFKYPFKWLYSPFIVLTFLNIIVTFQNLYGWLNIPFLTKDTIEVFYQSVSFLSIIYPLTLFLLSFRIVFLKKTKDYFFWIKIFWGLFFLIDLYGSYLELGRFLVGERKSYTYLWAAFSVVVYWMIYIGLYKFKFSNEKFEIRKYVETTKYSSIESNGANEYLDKLINLLTSEKIYLNAQLNREKVAEMLNISPGYLSQILGKTEYENLSKLINHYRVEEAKLLLKKTEFNNYSLVSVGLEVGFNSKSTFYNTFKKETGLTPNEFKKQVL